MSSRRTSSVSAPTSWSRADPHPIRTNDGEGQADLQPQTRLLLRPLSLRRAIILAEAFYPTDRLFRLIPLLLAAAVCILFGVLPKTRRLVYLPARAARRFPLLRGRRGHCRFPSGPGHPRHFRRPRRERDSRRGRHGGVLRGRPLHRRQCDRRGGALSMCPSTRPISVRETSCCLKGN